MRNNFFGTFHFGILAFLFLVLLSGCGYKAPPVYNGDTTTKSVSK
ncbi:MULTISPECIES: hypothetical protein [unclassified Campylobacter]|nr:MULTISPECIES: hypothetical protein [unclassified Campylobacter]MDA3056227.1 hypothetical protein [Campylobacter sp. CN_NA1]MDA3065372.1 hypothetical protein [Campylobacter sp. CN_NE4]MDA3068198.1 hypothetical protein [Campylobacter sp. CN_NE3]MDA3079660.1 hypothetical protein [Campylobacter sp. CS_NA2]MDA3080908.1 hypothetical protein [Campylobacter sp. CS_NA1]